ncbi:MAG: ATPase [Ruminococcaceae bacterium]|nr:ATPase [Oscillospiraceae bacterium]
MMKKFLGIELGSTRIKSVLMDETTAVIAQGSYEWENRLVDGLWSYSLEEVAAGLRASYAALASAYEEACGEPLTEISAMGVSAMMHGYLAFDENGELLVPFRTWRNTNTEQAAEELTELFSFNVPMRWSIAHYYQAILNGEPHAERVAYLTTLAGYVHEKLTGRRVLGIGDASGMFPINGRGYDEGMLTRFNALLQEKGIRKSLEELLPTALLAGEEAGVLTEAGAEWLDPSGNLKAGCVLCPPEGDAGTGMVATNSVTPGTANVSAGTSAFLMAVLEKNLNGYYKEIDVVTTPHGMPVAMVHVNNFTSEMTAWTNLFEEVISLGGGSISRGKLFDALYAKSLESDESCGGLVGYNFLSGEPIAGVANGVPLLARTPDGRLNLANFMKMQIYSALGSLAMGCDILEKEQVRIDSVCGHGGFFKAPVVGQRAMSAAVKAPVTVMQNAGEGGAWGVAVLAMFAYGRGSDFEGFLENLFAAAPKSTISADQAEIQSFRAFMDVYRKGLAIEKNASEVLTCSKN